MTYQQTIDFLYSRLPLFSRIGAAAIKSDLDNTLKLCAALGNPHKKIKTIHVAGTNGKGSVSHMLAAVLQTGGYKTGLYTSPHLKDFRERIKVNGEMVPEEFVTAFTQKITPLIETLHPSFFEVTVAMAFEWFAQQKTEIAVIETGLGGRLDSTNIITPELSVITNISFDHMDLLGDTLPLIASEKAGIIKPGIPVVIGEYNEETHPVFVKKARESDSPLTIASEKRWINNWEWKKHDLYVETGEENKQDHEVYQLDLTGIYQRKNLLTLLEACSVLKSKGWNTGEEIIRPAISKVKKLTGLHGRWEVIQQNPVVVVDVAHNADGIRQLVQQIEVTPHDQLHIIIGMVRDKDITAVFKILPVTARYYFTKAQTPRALNESELMNKASGFKLNGQTYPDVNSALQAALNHANENDLIVVCGSVYLVAEINKLSPSFSNA